MQRATVGLAGEARCCICVALAKEMEICRERTTAQGIGKVEQVAVGVIHAQLEAQPSQQHLRHDSFIILDILKFEHNFETAHSVRSVRSSHSAHEITQECTSCVQSIPSKDFPMEALTCSRWIRSSLAA